MPISPYVLALRAAVGHKRLLLASVTAVIRDPQGAILLVRSIDDDLWSTPGGVVELDETPAAAVEREVLEETGLQVRARRLLGVYGGSEFVVQYPNGDETQYLSTIFECEIRGGVPEPDGGEVSAVRFVTREEANRLPLAPWLPRVLPMLYQPDLLGWFEAVEDATA